MTWMPANPGFNLVQVMLLKGEFNVFVCPIVALNIKKGDYAYAFQGLIQTYGESAEDSDVIYSKIVAGEPTDFDKEVFIEVARRKRRTKQPLRLSDLAPATDR